MLLLLAALFTASAEPTESQVSINSESNKVLVDNFLASLDTDQKNKACQKTDSKTEDQTQKACLAEIKAAIDSLCTQVECKNK